METKTRDCRSSHAGLGAKKGVTVLWTVVGGHAEVEDDLPRATFEEVVGGHEVPLTDTLVQPPFSESGTMTRCRSQTQENQTPQT